MAERVVQRRPRPRNRCSITLSGGRSFTVPESEAGGFEPGTLLPPGEVTRLERMHDYMRGKEKALRLLAIRSRTRAEIERALEKLEINPAIGDGVIQELIDRGYLDDLRFTYEYIRAKMEFKFLGPHRLRADLVRMGVSRRYIDRAIGELCPAESQEELARRAVRRKVGERTPDIKTVKRMSDFLKRKGFDFEVVNRVTFELLEQAGRSDLHGDM